MRQQLALFDLEVTVEVAVQAGVERAVAEGGKKS